MLASVKGEGSLVAEVGVFLPFLPTGAAIDSCLFLQNGFRISGTITDRFKGPKIGNPALTRTNLLPDMMFLHPRFWVTFAIRMRCYCNVTNSPGWRTEYFIRIYAVDLEKQSILDNSMVLPI